MKRHWVVYCICFHVIALCIPNNCTQYYDFFFVCTFNFTGAEAESQTLAHDAKPFPSKSWKQPELLSLNRTAIFRLNRSYYIYLSCIQLVRFI